MCEQRRCLGANLVGEHGGCACFADSIRHQEAVVIVGMMETEDGLRNALADALAERDAFRAALAELVRLKRLKEVADRGPVRYRPHVGIADYHTPMAAKEEYERAKPAAWAAAFALIPE